MEFDPADVVCVPRDCSQQKIRCTQYKVIEEFKGELSGYSDYMRSEVKYTDEGSNEPDSWDDSDVAAIFVGDEQDDTCPACGEFLEYPDANYCSFCGEKLN